MVWKQPVSKKQFSYLQVPLFQYPQCESNFLVKSPSSTTANCSSTLRNLRNMWCVARFATICTILKMWKTHAEKLPRGCFSRCLSFTNGTKSRKTMNFNDQRVIGQFLDGHLSSWRTFPRQTVPRRLVPRRTGSRTDDSPNYIFPTDSSPNDNSRITRITYFISGTQRWLIWTKY